MRAIRHPNVVNIFEWSMPKDDPDAKPYVVMEMLEGEGLDRTLRRQRILPPQVAVAVLLQILDGLAAAHNVGVIHRDLGPSNVFLTAQPNGAYLVRVLDFGLARPVTGEEDANVTQAGTLMGKPGYVAPETFLQKPVDARVDLFAVGMILYRMLAGRLPYRETQAQLLWAERYGEKSHDREYSSIGELAAWVPEKLALISAKAIRRKPEERYQSAEDMQVDLLDIEDSVLVRAAAASPSPPPRPADHSSTLSPEALTGTSIPIVVKKRWLPAAGAAAAVAAVAVVIFLVWGRGGGGTAAAGADSNTSAAAEADTVASAGDPEAGPSSAADAAAAVEAVAVVPPPADAGSAEPVAEAAAEPAERTVLVVVSGAPDGATIKIGDEEIDPAEPKIRLAYSEDVVTVTVEASGFEKFTEVILPTSDKVVNVRMRAIRRPPPPRRDAGSTGPAFPEFPEGP